MGDQPFSLAVKALVTDAQGRLLVLRRCESSRLFPHQWDLPGGKVDAGERLDTALVREVAEETGLDVTVRRLAGASEYGLPEVRVVTLFFDMQLASGSVRLSAEHDAWQWISPAELGGLPLAEQLREFLSQLS